MKSQQVDPTVFKAFADEMTSFIEKGFDFEGYHAKLIFVCNAPARSFIIGVKYNSGFSSCPKCIIVGEPAVKLSEVQLRDRRVFRFTVCCNKIARNSPPR